MSRYLCDSCGYVYDEARGHPREGFPAGTPWSEVPDDFVCPDCGVRDKLDFQPMAEGAAAGDGQGGDGLAAGEAAVGGPPGRGG